MALARAAEVLLPVAGLLAALPVLYALFKGTWRELDQEAGREAASLLAANRTDARPLVAFVTAAVVFSVLHYYSGFEFFREGVRPVLVAWDGEHPWLRFGAFEELYAHGWWVTMRLGGFLLVPWVVNRALSTRGQAARFGLGAPRFQRAWVGAVFLALALPLVYVASGEPAFVRVYPNYGNAGRSGLDLLLWETMYLGQFLALEVFLRGWLMGMLRGLGSGAIFAITLPYCMMHFTGKPYAETIGAIVAGIFLGSLAAKTKSIWPGFLLHGTVALSMDWMALARGHRMPHTFWLPGA